MSKKSRRPHHAPPPTAPAAASELPLPLGRYARAYFAFLLVLAALFFLNFTLNHLIWSEYDEIANYDYIDKLTDGHFPMADQDISRYTLDITASDFTFQHPLGWHRTLDSMGLAGKSYQAQQPPLYFLLLTPLNFVMKWIHTAPPTQIKVLRSLNLLFFLGAAVLAITVVNELHEMFGWDRVYGYFVAVMSMVFGYQLRAHIGADQLAPLLGTLFFYLLVRQWRTNRQELVTWSALAASLAFLTKYTAGLCFPTWGLSTLFFYKKNPGLTWRQRIVHFTPFLLVVLYLGFNVVRAGDPLNTAGSDKLFAGALPKESSVWTVIRNLLYSSLDLDPGFSLPDALIVVALAAILFHYAVSFYRLFVQRKWSALPVFVACQTSVAIIVAVLMLCGYKPGFWYTFRIYSAFTVPWLVSLTATPLLFKSPWVRGASAVVGVLLATFCVYVRS